VYVFVFAEGVPGDFHTPEAYRSNCGCLGRRTLYGRH
jgi:hypothetical protein